MPETKHPSIAVSESEKKKSSYYRGWINSIISTNFTASWALSYNKLAMLYNFYKVGTGSDLTGYLQTAPDGSAMPGIWTSQNSVHTRFQSLIGELEERGYRIKARALNSEARARKYEERERLRIERHLQAVAQEAEAMTGLPLQGDEYIPQTDQELDEYMDLTWKDKHVQIIEAALKWIAQRTHWDEKRKQLFIDMLIGNMCVVRNDIVRGIPQSTPVDLLKFIYDPHATGDMKEDSTYFGEVDYMPLAAAAERYGMTLDEMEQAQKEYTQYLGMGMLETSEAHAYFGSMPGQTAKWFKTEDGVPRVLVVRACWRDIKMLAHKNEKNEKNGSEHLQNVTGEEIKKKDKEKIIYNKIECWRQGTIIGGKFLREWGECPNQARKLDSLEKSEPPYKVWTNSRSLSLAEQLVGLQMLKDIALYQLQVQQARAIGKVLVFDEAFMPEGMTKDSVVGRMKADGIIWINSKEYQIAQGNLNLFKEYDLSLSASIAQSIQLIGYFDEQINNISGVGQERMGQPMGASTAVGVQQSALTQQSLITAPLFRGFDRFNSRVLNHQAKLVKMAWGEGKEIFAPIIGDVGVDFLKDNIDISLDEFDVVVECLPAFVHDRNKFEQLIMTAVQTGELPVVDAIHLLMESDLTVALRKYQRKYALRKMEEARQQEQEMAMQERIEQQRLAAQGQNQQQMAQTQLQLQKMKSDTNEKNTLIGSRTKLLQTKLDLLNR